MATYNDDLALIVRYDGTKEAFINELTSNLDKYKNKVVFICGNNGTQEPSKDSLQAIWVSDVNGGRYLDTASFEYIRENLDRISTVKIGDTSLVADGASTLSMRPKLDGGISIGTATTESGETVIEFSVVNKADLDENGKIKISQIPDYMRSLMFGGTIQTVNALNNTITINPSNTFKSRFEVTGETVEIYNTPAQCEKYAGIYFISNTTGLFATKDIAPKDWVLSTGSIWDKIDNSDSVVSVAGLTGSITVSALAEKLSKDGIENELALKSEVDGKYEKPATGIPLTDLAQSAQTAIAASLQAVRSGTTTYIYANRSQDATPTVVVGANTRDITSFDETVDGLATTADVRKFLSAMLNVKVVSVNQ